MHVSNTICLILLIIKISISVGIVCYKCDSIALEACATTLNETDLPYDDCKSTECAMSIVDSITYRGCSDSTPSTGATYRKTCNDNLCNKGVYPPGRLKCYQCNGEGCVNPIGKPHPCPYHFEEDECYIDVVDETEIYRGCRSSINHTVSARAMQCDYNGCNNGAAVYHLKCAQCDSQQGRGCKRDLTHANGITQYETCEMDVPINKNGSCFIYHNLDRVVRGCTDRLDEKMIENPDRILTCSGPDFCNVGNLEEQQCLVCSSEQGDDNCRFNSSLVRPSVCSSPEVSSCYAVEFDNWHVERGCAVIPQNRTDKNREYECDIVQGCNRTPFTRCYKCSSDADANCATWQRPGLLEVEECEVPGGNCVMGTFSEGITRRGCESSQLNCTQTPESLCSLCQGNFCNRGEFPSGRLHCYQCGTLEDDCSKIIQNDPLPCPLNDMEPVPNEHQACFEYFNNQMGHIVRGCTTNGFEFYKCMLQLQPNCQLCSKNGCNNTLKNVNATTELIAKNTNIFK